MTIYDVMSRHIIVAHCNDSIWECAQKMKEMDIGFLPIVQKDKILGVVTDRDIAIKMISNHCALNHPIEGYMTKNPISISFEKSLEDVCSLMGKKKVKRVLVTDRNKVIGVLSLSDLVAHINSELLKETYLKIYEIYRNIEILDTEVDAFYL